MTPKNEINWGKETAKAMTGAPQVEECGVNWGVPLSHAEDAHRCGLPAGHEGPHICKDAMQSGGICGASITGEPEPSSPSAGQEPWYVTAYQFIRSAGWDEEYLASAEESYQHWLVKKLESLAALAPTQPQPSVDCLTPHKGMQVDGVTPTIQGRKREAEELARRIAEDGWRPLDNGFPVLDGRRQQGRVLVVIEDESCAIRGFVTAAHQDGDGNWWLGIPGQWLPHSDAKLTGGWKVVAWQPIPALASLERGRAEGLSRD